MRAFAFGLAISFLLMVAGAPAAGFAVAPARVASLKLCTDELLLLLAAPEQVASVTYLSQEPLESPLWRIARRYRKNDGSLLSVAPLAPDLVLDMGIGGQDSRLIAARLGARLLTLPYPQSLEDVEAMIATVATALGRQAQGRRLLAEMEALKHSRPSGTIDAIWVGGGGRSLAANSPGPEWMALAGLRQRQLPGDRLTLEELLVRPPPLLVVSDYRSEQYSSERRWLDHPLVRRGTRTRSVRTDGRLWTCAGPLLVAEIRRLRRVTDR